MPSDFGNSTRGKGKAKPKPKVSKKDAARIGRAVAGVGLKPKDEPPARRAAPAGDKKGASEFKKAEAHKKTPAYRQAVRDAYASRPLDERRERLKSGRKDAPETKVVEKLSADRQRVEGYKRAARVQAVKGGPKTEDVVKGLRVLRRHGEDPTDARQATDGVAAAIERVGDLVGRDITEASPGKDKGDDWFDQLSGGVGDAADWALRNLGGGGAVDVSRRVSPDSTNRAAKVLEVAAEAPLQIGRAASEDPDRFAAETAKAIVRAIPAAIGGAVELPVKVIKDGPADAAKDTADQVAGDYGKRYAKLAAGDRDGFRDDVRKDPGAFGIDLLSGGAAGAAVAGRAAGAVTRGGLLGERVAQAANRPRPKLRTAPGRAEPQALSDNEVRALVQRVRDTARSRVTERRAERGDLRGVQPQAPDEVVQIRRGSVSSSLVGQAVGKRVGSQAKRLRVQAATINSRSAQRMRQLLDREVRPAEGAARKLTPAEDLARPLVLQGLLPLDDPAAALSAVDAQIAAVRGYRQDTGFTPTLAGTDELPRLQRLRAQLERDPDTVLTDRLRAFHRDEVERQQRLRTVAGDAFEADVLEARRWRPVLVRFSPDEDRAIDELAEQLANDPDAPADGMRTLRELVAWRGRQIAEQQGLPEPVYVLHRESPQRASGSFAAGSGARGAGPARYASDFELLRRGSWDPSHTAYVEGLARTAKRSVSFRQAAEIAEDFALPASRGEDGSGITYRDARRLLDRMAEQGADPADFAFWSPKVVRDGELDAAELVDVEQGPGGVRDRYADTDRGFLIPRQVADEIDEASRPTGDLGRAFGNVQALQSRLLIYTNPAFPLVQVLSNTPLALFTVGARDLSAFLKAPGFFRDLDPDVRDDVRALFANEGAGQSMTRTSRRGALANTRKVDASLEAGYRAFSLLGVKDMAAAVGRGVFGAIPKADRLQDGYLRDVAAFAELRKNERALRGTVAKAADVFDHQRPVIELLRMDQDRARLALRDPNVRRDVERMADRTVELLGDYARYSAAERKVLRKALLFYGFLRHSLRLLAYTLPLNHPLLAAAGVQLGRLHADEVQALLGGEDLPWAYSRVFLGKDGTTSVDLGRFNPLTNQLTQIAGAVATGDRRLQGITQTLPPIASILLEQGTGQDLFRGRPLRLDGKPGTPEDVGLDDRLEVIVNRLEGLPFPLREIRAARDRTAGDQGDDSSLLFGAEPTRYAEGGEADQRNQDKKRKASEQDDAGYWLGRLVPLFPRPDDTVANARRRAADERDRKRKADEKAARIRMGLDPAPLSAEDRAFRKRYGLAP